MPWNPLELHGISLKLLNTSISLWNSIEPPETLWISPAGVGSFLFEMGIAMASCLLSFPWPSLSEQSLSTSISIYLKAQVWIKLSIQKIKLIICHVMSLLQMNEHFLLLVCCFFARHARRRILELLLFKLYRRSYRHYQIIWILNTCTSVILQFG